MKEDSPGFDSPVGYGALPLNSEEDVASATAEGSDREHSESADPGPESQSTVAGETEPPREEPGTGPDEPGQSHADSADRDDVRVEEKAPEREGTDAAAREAAASEVATDSRAMPQQEHVSRGAGEGGDQPPPASDVQSSVGGAEQPVVEEMPPDIQVEIPPTIEEQPRSRLGRRKKKGKDAKRAEALRQPTQQEIFQRLMEKNEVILQLTKKNAELEARRKSLEDKRIQLLAEFENYRKRTRKEWDLLKQQARAEVLVELLKVVDDFERAFAALGDQENEFTQGIRLIYNNMMALLASFGVTKMVALGQRFDPNCHMAVAHTESPEFEPNHIVEVVLDGYLMDGALLRPASVVIAK